LKGLSKTTETTDIELNKTDSMSRTFLEKLVVPQLVNKCPVFFGIGVRGGAVD
jgi:hypothetical protein